MAFVTEFTCRKCEQPRNEVVDPSRICHECRHKAATKAKRVHLAGLKGLTPDERLARIEELLYDLRTESRLSALESHHIHY